jgi:polyisoprenoid-binding protein YceI
VTHNLLPSTLFTLLLARIKFSFCRIVQCSVLFGFVGWTVVASADVGIVYTIDPIQSEFAVQLFKAGAGAVLAHDHVVRASTFTGRVQIDLAAPATGLITVEVQTASLKVDEPTARQKYGLPSQLSEKDRQQIQETMMSTSQLDVAYYPIIKFISTQIETQGNGIYTVTGKLTIRGITQSVTFLAQAERREHAFHVRGSFRFKQSSFGYEPYSAFFSTVRNQDEVL